MGLPRETRRDESEEVLAPTLGAETTDTTDASHLPAGAVLGDQYRVVRRLGQGGMGTVYVVEHTDLGRRFAAKVVTNKLSDMALERLLNEARVTSGISHKNIVDVVNLGRDKDGSVFVIMELLKGEDLGQRLERQLDDHPDHPWLPDAELKRYVPQMLSGLRAAHEAGVIHRDLKPENVFLASEADGRMTVKLLDFGIAKNVQPDGNHRLTRTGQIIGTPLYMAPEQARNMSDADNRADIYSIGVILYEMATGGPPFEADTLFDLIVQHATLPAKPPRERRPDLPEAVEEVIVRCLHKKREHRFDSVEQLQKAWADAWKGIRLEPLDVSPEELARPLAAQLAVPAEGASAEPRERRFAPRAPLFLGVAILALLVGGGAAWVFGGTNGESATIDSVGDPAPVNGPAATLEDPVVEPTEEVETVVRLLQSSPQGATVSRDGEPIGTTPLTVRVPEDGEVALLVSLEGYEVSMVTLAGDSTDRVDVALDRDPTARRGRRGRRMIRTQTQSQTPTETPVTRPPETTVRPPRAPRGNDILLGMDEFDSDRGR